MSFPRESLEYLHKVPSLRELTHVITGVWKWFADEDLTPKTPVVIHRDVVTYDGVDHPLSTTAFETVQIFKDAAYTDRAIVLKTRLGELALPATKIVQFGRILEMNIVWETPSRRVLESRPRDSVGIKGAKTTFHGFEETQGVYMVSDVAVPQQRNNRCMRVFEDSDSAEKLIPEPTQEARITSIQDNDNNDEKDEMIKTSDVAMMFCELGINLAKHFDLDATEVVEYLDSVAEDTIGVNPQATPIIKEIVNDGASDLTQEMVDEWFAAPTNGGLSMKDLRAKAAEYSIGVKGLKKAEMKEEFEKIVAEADDDEESEADDEEESEEVNDAETVTQGQVDEWFAAPAKGGMSMKDLRAKATELGLEAKGLKKTELKEAFEGLVVADDDAEESEADDDDEESDAADDDDTEVSDAADDDDAEVSDAADDDAEVSDAADDDADVSEANFAKVTQGQVDEWFAAPAKGGLSMKDLRAKATELGLEAKGLKKTELKEAFEALLNLDTKAEEESEAVDDDDADADDAEESEAVVDDDAEGESEAVDDAEEESDTEVPVKSAETGRCIHMGSRGQNKGKRCEIKPKAGDVYCAKHTSTQQAHAYRSNESPLAKKAAKKLSQESDAEDGPKIRRNKPLKVWFVEGENLVVRSAKNPKVYGYITKKGDVSQKLTQAYKLLAHELGLEVEKR
jgi:hypothetical protein